jgi:tRNA1(Val) A37 N6-methylase TrmN6
MYILGSNEMPELELVALQNCKGKVLDVGAGAGGHALLLQQYGLNITALEISPAAAEVMKARGVEKIEVQDFIKYSGEKFDTVLLLMNGIGIAVLLKV